MVKLAGGLSVPIPTSAIWGKIVLTVESIQIPPTPYCSTFLTPSCESESEHEKLDGTSSQAIIDCNLPHKASAGAIDINSIFLLHFVSFRNPNTD